MSFRKYGGLNYSAKQNFSKNHYAISDNVSVTEKVGEPNTNIIFASNIVEQNNLNVQGSSTFYGLATFLAPVYVENDLYGTNGSFQELTVSNIITDSITTSSFNSSSIDVTGNITGGSFNSPEDSFNVTSSGALTASSITTSSFNTSSIDITGNITAGSFNASTDSFYVTSSGAITGISLDTGSGTITTSGNITAGSYNASDDSFYVTSSGAVYSTSSFNVSSDYRIKDKIEPINLTKFSIDHLNPVTYINKNTDKQDIGLIAHELQKVFPFLVNGEKDDPDKMQSVNYIGLISLLVKEVQDLKQKVTDLTIDLKKSEQKHYENHFKLLCYVNSKLS